MAEHNFQGIEKKWQKDWKEKELYKVPSTSDKPKYYILDMFPYPSGSGLHVGHPLGYIASDIVARYKRLKGFNVLHPMGFDSFGLPAEQHAIKTGQHPAVSTEKNITRYIEQLSSLGFSYDWSREVRTSDPSFYKWTQWIFLKLYEKGLAYEADSMINWCPNDKAVLANEEVKNGRCDRCNSPVVRRKLRQWILRITEYADRLLDDLEGLDWPESIKLSQTNWIGKSEGAELDFSLSPDPSPQERDFNWQTANPNLAKKLVEFARENRKNPTEQEDTLWQELRNKKLGFKVRRQHPIGDFIADFAFLNEKLVVEIDGSYHEQDEQIEFDQARTSFLQDAGFDVMVVKNEEVDGDLEGVLKTIKDRLNGLSLNPSPKERDFNELSPSPSEKGPGVGAKKISVYTTRPDTIYGATYMVIAPEHKLVDEITTDAQKQAVANYVEAASKKSDLERTELDKSKTGEFTGAYAINPVSGEEIPIWISDYVLISYGTGAIMAVPGGDQRDFEFAKKFDLPILQVVSPDGKEIEDQQEAYGGKGIMLNSGEYNGMDSEECKKLVIESLEKEGKGKGAVNYKLRDWIFTRQRYWGEPIPIIHCEKCGTVPVPEDQLPVTLPDVESYLPTDDGQSPLATDWVNTTCPKCGEAAKRETNTMPQWGGSCWYYLRYLDPSNDEKFVDSEIEKYWMNVDFYIGGAEHAVLHLLYSRFWHKVLFDLGYVSTNEPFQKLVNQGMIQGRSSFVYRVDGKAKIVDVDDADQTKMADVTQFLLDNPWPIVYVSKDLLEDTSDEIRMRCHDKIMSQLENEYSSLKGHFKIEIDLQNSIELHIPIEYVRNDKLIIEDARKWLSSHPDAEDLEFIPNSSGDYICGWEIEKMSKSKYNVVNPDDLIQQYGADTLRMYEMFLGPIEQSKPWNTNGIEGVFKFLRKFWNLFHDGDSFNISNEDPTKEELKTLHGLIKKVEYDCENLSLNTSVSAFMIAVNELGSLKCNKRAILERMTILLSPFAPHLAEELWSMLGYETSVVNMPFPTWDEKHLAEDSFEYPISINGKMRVKLNFGLDMSKEDIEREVLANDTVQKWTEGKPPKKVIVVPKRIVNVVV